MKTWLMERYLDPAKFIATMRALLSFLGALFAFDVIPTGVPGLGPKVAAAMNVLAFGIPAGTKTASELEPKAPALVKEALKP